MEKKRSIISYEKLSPELIKQFKKTYPEGYGTKVQKLQTPKELLTVVPLETPDTIYLVKVKLQEKKSKAVDDDDDDDLGEDFNVPDTAGFKGEKDEFDDDEEEEDEDYDQPDEDDDDED